MSAENLSADMADPAASTQGNAAESAGSSDTRTGHREQASDAPAAGRGPSAHAPLAPVRRQGPAERLTAHSGDSRLPLGARPARNAVIGAGLIGYAWWLAGTTPFSTKALIGVLLPGAVLGAIAYGRPPERIPPPERLDVTGASYWLICIALLFEWEASAVRDNSPPWHPALTNLIDPLIAPQPVKCAAIVIWLLAGWALVKR